MGTAASLAARIKLGLNIGNTLEAFNNSGIPHATSQETWWGNPQITQQTIDTAKSAGFDAIRLPCSWNQYSNEATAKISDSWLGRVKDVVARHMYRTAKLRPMILPIVTEF